MLNESSPVTELKKADVTELKEQMALRIDVMSSRSGRCVRIIAP